MPAFNLLALSVASFLASATVAVAQGLLNDRAVRELIQAAAGRYDFGVPNVLATGVGGKTVSRRGASVSSGVTSDMLPGDPLAASRMASSFLASQEQPRVLHMHAEEGQVSYETAASSSDWSYYEGRADVLIGMADPLIAKGIRRSVPQGESTAVAAEVDGAGEEVVLQHTFQRAPRIAQITLLDSVGSDGPAVYDLQLPVGSEAWSAFTVSMKAVPVRGVFSSSSAAQMDTSAPFLSQEATTTDGSTSTASDVMTAAAPKPVFIMSPDLSPPCSEGSTFVSCSVGGQMLSFERPEEAKVAVVEALAEGISRVFEEHAVPLPRALASGAGAGAGGRRAYVNPAFSLGAVRTILFVRALYNGQVATGTIITHEQAQALATNATRELNRSAMGATSFSFTVAPQVVTMAASTPVCTSSYALVETSTKAALQAQQGINSASYSHLVILLPKCPTWAFNGLAYIPGSTVWVPLGTDPAFARTVTHEVGHNLGANHAGAYDLVTGIFTEYFDLLDPMSTGDNDYERRDYCAGFKHDFGWLPSNKVLALGGAGDSARAPFVCREARRLLATTQAEIQEICGDAPVYLLPLDRGQASIPANTFEAQGDSFFTVRWLHPQTWSSSVEDRQIYSTYRYRAADKALASVVLNEVPLTVGVAGHTALVDLAPWTAGQHDAGLPPAAAYTLESADGLHLVENLGTVQDSGLAGAADSLIQRQKGALKLRLRKLTSTSDGFSVQGGSLGCFGSSCQVDYRQSIVDVPLACGSGGGGASVTVAVPVSDLGYPHIARILTSAGSEPFAVKARLCIPDFLSSELVSISLAAHEGELPVAEALTASPLNRSSFHHLSSYPLLSPITGSSVPLPSAYQLDLSCRELSFFVRPPPQGSPDAYSYILASARYLGGHYPSADAALQPLEMEVSCVDGDVSGDTPYGPIISSGPLLSHTHYRLSFNNEFFDGVYHINPLRPLYNNALLLESEDGTYVVGHASGSWYIFTADLQSFYRRQVGATNVAQDSPDVDIASVATFDGMPFSIRRACPAGSVRYQGGCVPCPFGTEGRLGSSYPDGPAAAALADVALPRLNETCFANAGNYLAVSESANADGFRQYLVKSCPANTYKERPGNSFNQCLPCPTGWSSNEGSIQCGYDSGTPSASAAERGFTPCASFALRDWQKGWNGTYILSSSAQGRLVYLLKETASMSTPSYAVFEPISGRWVFNNKPTTLSTFFYRVASFRPPWKWTRDAEFDSVEFPNAAGECLETGQVALDQAADGTVCGLDKYVGTAASPSSPGTLVDICLPCTFGMRRLETPGSSKPCGCPLGFLVHKDYGCRRPYLISIGVLPAEDGTSAIAGTYAACRMASVVDDGMAIAWQQVERASSSAFSPSSQLFLVFDPAANSWSVLSGSTSVDAAPRYAYLPSRAMEFSGTGLILPVSFTSSLVTMSGEVEMTAPTFFGASMAVTNVSMIPLGPQPGWRVFRPWPTGFEQAAVESVSISLKASSDAMTGDEGALPFCGDAGVGPIDSSTAASLLQSGALASGAGLSTVLHYEASTADGLRVYVGGGDGAAVLMPALAFVPSIAPTPTPNAIPSKAPTATQTPLPPLAATALASSTPNQTPQPTMSPWSSQGPITSVQASSVASSGTISATRTAGSGSASPTASTGSSATRSPTRSPSVSASRSASLSRGASASKTASASGTAEASPSSEAGSSVTGVGSSTRSPVVSTTTSPTPTRSASQTIYPAQLASISFSFRLYMALSGMPSGVAPSLLKSASSGLCAAAAAVLTTGDVGAARPSAPSSSFTVSCASLSLKGSSSASARELGSVPILTDPTGSCDPLVTPTGNSTCKLVGVTMMMQATDPAALVTDQGALKSLNPPQANSTGSNATSTSLASAQPVSIPLSALQPYTAFLTNETASATALLAAVGTAAVASSDQEAALMNKMLASATNLSPSRSQSGAITVFNATAGPPSEDAAVNGTADSGGSNAGKIVGVVIGCILLLALVLCVAYYLMKRRRKMRDSPVVIVQKPVIKRAAARPDDLSDITDGTSSLSQGSSSVVAAPAADDERSSISGTSGNGASAMLGASSVITNSAPDLSGKTFAARRASMIGLGLGLESRERHRDGSSSSLVVFPDPVDYPNAGHSGSIMTGGTVPRLPSVKGLVTSKASKTGLSDIDRDTWSPVPEHEIDAKLVALPSAARRTCPTPKKAARDLDQEPGSARSRSSRGEPSPRTPKKKAGTSGRDGKRSTESSGLSSPQPAIKRGASGSSAGIRRNLQPPPLSLTFSPAGASADVASGRSLSLADSVQRQEVTPSPAIPAAAAASQHRQQRSARLTLPDVSPSLPVAPREAFATTSPLRAVAAPVQIQPEAGPTVPHRRQESASSGLPPRVPPPLSNKSSIAPGPHGVALVGPHQELHRTGTHDGKESHVRSIGMKVSSAKSPVIAFVKPPEAPGVSGSALSAPLPNSRTPGPPSIPLREVTTPRAGRAGL